MKTVVKSVSTAARRQLGDMCWGIFAIHNLGAYISVILLFEYSACKYTRADDMLYMLYQRVELTHIMCNACRIFDIWKTKNGVILIFSVP